MVETSWNAIDFRVVVVVVVVAGEPASIAAVALPESFLVAVASFGVAAVAAGSSFEAVGSSFAVAASFEAVDT